jgi:hypothetical protein
MNQSDPVIDEVREVRHRISARFHHDPALLVAYYMELQDQYRERLVVTHEVSTAAELSRPTRRSSGREKRRAPLNLGVGGRGAKEGQAGGVGPTRPWTAPVRLTRVRRHAGVDTAKVLAFPMLFTRLSGVARQGRKATQGEAGNMKKSRSKRAESPSELIDARIEDLGDWRGEMLSRLRALIKEADPEVAEEWKWRGTPVWSHNGLICTGETYKNVVKMTFAKGASLKDPSGLFNSSLEGNARRAIDFHEGDKLDEEALKALIRAAVALNKSSARG